MFETKSAAAPEWNRARGRAFRKDTSRRQAVVFIGESLWEETTIAGVSVSRLSVIAAGAKTAPTTGAIVHHASWRKCISPPLTGSLSWQQSLDARYEVFFKLSATTRCFGLGERFSPLNLRGQVHSLVTADNHQHNEGMDALYKAIPFLIMQDGTSGKFTGMFVDTGAPTRWDLDSELNGNAVIEILTRRGWQLYVFAATTLPQLIEAFTTLTGRAPLPPRWSLGHQQCRWSYADDGAVHEVVKEYRSRKIPCDTVVLDIDYMDDYRVFTSSRERFPHFKELMRDLARENFKVVTIVDPGVKEDPNYDVYKEGKQDQLFCMTPSGDVFIDTVWPGRSAFPDFEQNATRAWWSQKHQWFVDQGVAGIWNDMNEPAFFNEKSPVKSSYEELPPDTQQHGCMQRTPDGMVGHFEVRNLYGFHMCLSTYTGLLAARPKERPFVLTRSGYAGIQRYAAVWLGDNMSWFEHLRNSIPMLLNVSLSGAAFCGVDVGGFGGDTSPELLVRWYETGIFYPFLRNHSCMGTRAQEPYAFDEQVEKHIRNLIETRYRLLPYLQQLFWEHRRTGAPIMRPLLWHYPKDKFAAEIDDQFMFGADILVAPILTRGKTMRPIYLPEGRWHPYSGGDVLEGGQTHIVDLPLGSVPAFLRDGAIIPQSEIMQHTGEYNDKAIAFSVIGDEARGTYIEDDGISVTSEQGGFNEWRLEFSDGKLRSEKLNDGYKAPPRRFYVSHLGEFTELTLA